MANEKELITAKLNYLDETKQIIKNAIIEKGQAVSEDDTFRDYATKILDIQSGEGSDTSDATAQPNDILEGVTAYIADGKVEGTIKKSYGFPTSITTYNLSALTKSLSYNFGLSDDFMYLVDFRTVNNVATIVIYKFDETDKNTITQVATTTENLPGNTTNPDIQFSPIIDKGIYRFALSCGRYTSVYEFDSVTLNIKFLLKTDISSYTSNSIYCISWANLDKNIFAVTHTNLNSWGYGPVTTCFKLVQDVLSGEYQYTTLWNTATSRWQAGHSVFFAQDDKAFCYCNVHNDQIGAGYYELSDTYGLGTKYNSWYQQCAVDLTNGHRIVDKNIQVLNGSTWTTTGTIPNTPSDPDFIVIDANKDIFITGQSVSGSNYVRVYQVGWSTGTTTLLYTATVPIEHQYFGSNNGSQVIGNIRFSKNRLLFHNRKTTPVIAQIKLTDNIDQLTRDNKKYKNPATMTGTKATASQVLSGYHYYNDDLIIASGTMTNQGSISFTPSTSTQSGSAGYYSSISVGTVDSSSDYAACLSLTNNILDGVEKILPDDIADTGDGTATEFDISYGKIAYVNGNKVIGKMKTNSTERYFRDIMHFAYVPNGILDYVLEIDTTAFYLTYFNGNEYMLYIINSTDYENLKLHINNTLPTIDFDKMQIYINNNDIMCKKVTFDKDTIALTSEEDIEWKPSIITLKNDGSGTVPFETNIPIYSDNSYAKRLIPNEIVIVKSYTVEQVGDSATFSLIDNDWYENTNNDIVTEEISEDYAYVRLNFEVAESGSEIKLEYIPTFSGSNEAMNEPWFFQEMRYGISQLDKTLGEEYSMNNTIVSSDGYTTIRYGNTNGKVQTLTYTNVSAGNHFIEFKIYRRNMGFPSEFEIRESLKFKIYTNLY